MTGWNWRLACMLALIAGLAVASCAGTVYGPAPDEEISAVRGGSDSDGGGSSM